MHDEDQEVQSHRAHDGSLRDPGVDAYDWFLHVTEAVLLWRLGHRGGRGLELSLGSWWLGGKVVVQDRGQDHSGCHTDDWCQGQHETDHNTREVGGENGIDNNEDLLIIKLQKAEINSSWEQPNEHIQIEKECWPRGWLMLRNRSDNRNVNLGVSGIPKRVETSSPWCDDTRDGEEDETTQSNGADCGDESEKEGLKLLAWYARAHEFHESNKLQQSKYTKRGHMLGTANWQESNERNLHTSQRAKRIPSTISDVDSWAETAHENQDENVQWDQVGDEDVASPRGHHVAVEQRAKSAPECGAELDGFDPEVEREDQEENGDSFVVVGSRNGAGDISWCDTHEDSSQQSSGWTWRHLIREKVCCEGSQAGESWGEKHADVADVDWDCECAEGVVNGARGDHEAWVERAAGDTAERVPGAVIEPVPEVVEAIGDEVLCCSEVEPWVDCAISVCLHVLSLSAVQWWEFTNIRG